MTATDETQPTPDESLVGADVELDEHLGNGNPHRVTHEYTHLGRKYVVLDGQWEVSREAVRRVS